MNIKVDEIAPDTTRRYNYTHRVEVAAGRLATWPDDADSVVQVASWLNEHKIPHTRLKPNVFYLSKQNTEWLLLRWS